MITIRSERKEDHASIYKVNKLAFKQEGEAKLVDEIRLTPQYIEQLSLVAEYEGSIVGHVMFSQIGIETDQGMICTLGLAPVAVLPEVQGQGIGSSLIREGIRRSKELGYAHIVVLGHAEYYPRFGFITAARKGIQCPFSVPEEVFMVLELMPDSLQGINGIVKYPEAFNNV